MVSPLLSLAAATLLAANPYLDEGRALYQQLEYEKAAERLELARAATSGTEAEKQEVLELLGRSYVALGEHALARARFGELLQRNPHAPAPADASPKISSAFLDAKKGLYPPGYVRLERVPAAAGEESYAVVDPWSAVAAVVLVGEVGSEVVLPVEDHRARVEAGPALPEGAWSLEARSEAGAVLARVEQVRGLSAPPAAPVGEVVREGPRWPLWVVGGLAVAAAGAGAYYGVSAAGDARAARDAHWGSETAALNRGAREKAIAANVLLGGALLAGGGVLVMHLTW